MLKFSGRKLQHHRNIESMAAIGYSVSYPTTLLADGNPFQSWTVLAHIHCSLGEALRRAADE